MMKFNTEVDTTGLQCPLPLLRLKKSLSKMLADDVVRIIATDPAAHLDIGVYVEQSGHEMMEHFKEESRHILEVGAPPRFMIDFGTPCHKNRFATRRLVL